MLLFAASQTSAMRLCALIVLALWSGVAAQDPCACKGECRTIFGEYLCYVEGGESCSRATPSMFRSGEAWIPCPEETSTTTPRTTTPEVEDPVEADGYENQPGTSGVAAQDPCACKGKCRTIFGEYLCYVEGGES